MPRSFPCAPDDDPAPADSAHPRCRDPRALTAVAAAPRPCPRFRFDPALCHRPVDQRAHRTPERSTAREECPVDDARERGMPSTATTPRPVRRILLGASGSRPRSPGAREGRRRTAAGARPPKKRCAAGGSVSGAMTTPRATIRTARIAERLELEELQRRSSMHEPMYRAQLEAHPDAIELPTEQIALGHVRVAELDGVVIGFVALFERIGDACELDALFVEPGRMR